MELDLLKKIASLLTVDHIIGMGLDGSVARQAIELNWLTGRIVGKETLKTIRKVLKAQDVSTSALALHETCVTRITDLIGD